MTQNNLGLALAALADRGGTSKRLHEAVAAYRASLTLYARDRTPLQWATVQNNLGVSLAMLGERERDPQRLHEAVTAFRSTLEVYTRDAMPVQWASIQDNLARALNLLERFQTMTRAGQA